MYSKVYVIYRSISWLVLRCRPSIMDGAEATQKGPKPRARKLQCLAYVICMSSYYVWELAKIGSFWC